MEKVILVDNSDRELGTMEKMQAHKDGVLHRAFSVFVFNAKGELMLQRRADHKYHSAGLWTNTCCSHPREKEKVEEAAARRLIEEMGFHCPLKKAFHFIYKSEMGNGLIEHELDHVFIGEYDQTPSPYAEEVADWKWMHPNLISDDIAENPDHYTAWFKICFDQVILHFKKNKAA